MIQFRCNKCQKTYKVAAKHAGKKTRCAECDNLIIVPAVGAESVPESVVPPPIATPKSGPRVDQPKSSFFENKLVVFAVSSLLLSLTLFILSALMFWNSSGTTQSAELSNATEQVERNETERIQEATQKSDVTESTHAANTQSDAATATESDVVTKPKEIADGDVREANDSSKESQPTPSEPEPVVHLEVVSWTAKRQENFLLGDIVVAKGKVKNLTDQPLRDVWVSMSGYTVNGTLDQSGRAKLELATLLPGQVSDFSVNIDVNPQVLSVRVQFESFFGAAKYRSVHSNKKSWIRVGTKK